MVSTTWTAGIFSPLMTLSSTGMPRPSSTTVMELSTWMVTSMRVRMSAERLVDGVVDDLIDQVMQAHLAGRADVHRRTQADRRKTFENGDVLGRVAAALFFRVGASLILPASSSKRAPSVGIAVDAMYLHSAVAEVAEFSARPVSAQSAKTRAVTALYTRSRLILSLFKYSTGLPTFRVSVTLLDSGSPGASFGPQFPGGQALIFMANLIDPVCRSSHPKVLLCWPIRLAMLHQVSNEVTSP